MDKITLEIITPEGAIFNGEVTSVTLPGAKDVFTVLIKHAPIISALTKGKIIYNIDDMIFAIESNGGVVEVKNNVVTVCLETIIK